MKYIDQLNIILSQFINLNFIPKDIKINELYLVDFSLLNYNIIDFNYYPRKITPAGNKETVRNNLSRVKNFIENIKLEDFSNLERYDRYVVEITAVYISVLLEEIKIESFISDPKNLKLIFKSPQYSYVFLESKRILDENYYNKYKEEAEKALLNGNLFWAYKYSYYILNGPFQKLEDDPSFIKNDSLVDQYFNKIVFRRGFFNPKKELMETFYKYWNHSILSIKFKKILSTIDMVQCFYFFRDYHIQELEEYFINNRTEAFVDYFIDITFYDNHMRLEDQYISEKTEDLDDKILRLSKVIINNPYLLEIFISKMKNKEDLFKIITKTTIDEYIEQNAPYIKKSLLKDLEILIRFIEFSYLKKHSLVKKEFPEAIEAILKSKNPNFCFFYLKDIILKSEPDTDPKEITPFLDVISTSSTYSLMYVIISKKRFPQGEKAIFSNPSDKKEYLELIEDGYAK